MTPTYEIVPCPTCGARESREVADRESLRRELEQLWGFHLRRLRTGVPVERLFDRVVFSQEPPLRLAECEACGTVFRNPREREEAVVELYAEEEPDPGVLEALFQTQRRSYRTQARRLTRLAGGAGRGVEVGSYVGAFLDASRAHGWNFTGVDVNAAASGFARQRGFRVTVGTLDAVGPEGGYDSVAIWNCYEQLPDPRAAARTARSLLRPGGVLAVRVPSGAFYAALRPWLESPLSAAARALLAHNNLLGFPYRHGFRPEGLGALLRAEGFEVLAVVGDALVPIADRWTRRWAAWEERALKATLRTLARPDRSPWFEVYARRSPHP